MRLVTYMRDGQVRHGARIGERIREYSAARCILDIVSDPGGATGGEFAVVDVQLLPPLTRPGKIICVGLNYTDHAKEGGNPIPDYPAIFLRAITSIASPGAPLIRPSMSEKLDFEAELAVVIGRTASRVSPAQALCHVAGYTCFNDGSVRDYQRKSTQWTIGKNFDRSGSFGPELVTADALPSGAHGLRITSRVNGKVMQDGNTGNMIFSVATLVSVLSECMTLEPGDIIATGTPAGVGYARTPPIFLKHGDVCEIEIEGIGTLRNPISDAVPADALEMELVRS
ncbi:fumarylacetoacetate hydrolase family protein [Ancylobacter sp. IITR112]|uniref:fumarylacetoacetate hydrolase family protein n=1 Tax=Ancylobacter sp. IITR112 TaxID=3138073 RepID=UPI00352B1777